MTPTRKPISRSIWLQFPFIRFAGLVTFLFIFSGPAQALQNPPDGGCFVFPSPATGNTARVVYNLTQSGAAAIFIYNEAGDLVAQEQASNKPGIQQTALDLTH